MDQIGRLSTRLMASGLPCRQARVVGVYEYSARFVELRKFVRFSIHFAPPTTPSPHFNTTRALLSTLLPDMVLTLARSGPEVLFSARLKPPDVAPQYPGNGLTVVSRTSSIFYFFYF